ncbi:ADC synthase [Pavlovales sp. CCMP2436]|nr:ADC synthase [Pavlovales sp. CCMP2436]
MGAPKARSQPGRYTTEGGITVDCSVRVVEDDEAEFQALVDSVDVQCGLILESSYEFPGRYAHWTMGFTAPPLVLEAWGRSFTVTALNARGKVLLRAIQPALSADSAVESLVAESEGALRGHVRTTDRWFSEEERSKQPSIFSVVRCLVGLFACENEPQLGLYGSFGYDLALQFEPIELRADRGLDGQRDLVLYLPDQIFVHDIVARDAWVVSYEFSIGEVSPPLPLYLLTLSPHPPNPITSSRGTLPDYFFYNLRTYKSLDGFSSARANGVKAHAQKAAAAARPRARRVSRPPSPPFFSEFLVGASPEMFVRVEPDAVGLRVETCPISGTIRRGADALEDAANIKTILSDPKEESELTMCTDVDRNDKSRICEPGSVKVIGRRQIEMYSRLIHTVDHVEGYLRPGYDALDAFLCHMWAVTVTGAPKLWAMRFVEKHERSQRAWYGGAIGMAGFDGRINTGLTLRTVHIQHGETSVRAGATLLYDSVPALEEAETELKVGVLLATAKKAGIVAVAPISVKPSVNGAAFAGLRVVLVDHQDSFVHTLANYLKQTGASVVTVRSGFDYSLNPELVVLSPGPGNPRDFKCSELLAELERRKVAVFGVCLGLQAMVEHFGGELHVLPHPQHGKPADVRLVAQESSPPSMLSHGLPNNFQVVARYHSLYRQ